MNMMAARGAVRVPLPELLQGGLREKSLDRGWVSADRKPLPWTARTGADLLKARAAIGEDACRWGYVPMN